MSETPTSEKKKIFIIGAIVLFVIFWIAVIFAFIKFDGLHKISSFISSPKLPTLLSPANDEKSENSAEQENLKNTESIEKTEPTENSNSSESQNLPTIQDNAIPAEEVKTEIPPAPEPAITPNITTPSPTTDDVIPPPPSESDLKNYKANANSGSNNDNDYKNDTADTGSSFIKRVEDAKANNSTMNSSDDAIPPPPVGYSNSSNAKAENSNRNSASNNNNNRNSNSNSSGRTHLQDKKQQLLRELRGY